MYIYIYIYNKRYIRVRTRCGLALHDSTCFSIEVHTPRGKLTSPCAVLQPIDALDRAVDTALRDPIYATDWASLSRLLQAVRDAVYASGTVTHRPFGTGAPAVRGRRTRALADGGGAVGGSDGRASSHRRVPPSPRGAGGRSSPSTAPSLPQTFLAPDLPSPRSSSPQSLAACGFLPAAPSVHASTEATGLEATSLPSGQLDLFDHVVLKVSGS